MKIQANKFQTIKGVRDILPPESALWNRVEQAAREVFETYGYGEIRLPTVEATELFDRAVGTETDIVAKEMYRIENRLESLRGWCLVAMALHPSRGRADVSEQTPFFIPLTMFVQEAQTTLEEGTARISEKSASAIHTLYDMVHTTSRIEDWEDFRKRAAILLGQIELERLVLRPEATASVVRAYIEHGMHTRLGSVKLYYLGPMFRRERPQKGRYRQFYQIGAELLGPSEHAALDAEVIEMLLAFFARVKLQGTTLHLNSIGCAGPKYKDCRSAYVTRLRSELQKVCEKLGPDSQRRIETNPLRVLDSKVPEEQPIIETLPRIGDHLCDPCREHYAKVKQELALRGIPYQENWRLVRGLDYYMRTTFEITAPGLGSQNAVCGGGRYDGLVELLGGPAATKGIGFAIGTDRLILSLQQDGKAAPSGGIEVFLAWFGAGTYPAAVALARKLREQGMATELQSGEMKFGKSLGLADRLGARYAVILGEDEMASGQITVKRLADSDQKKLSEADLLTYLLPGRR